jgi:hypothetical protein
MSTLKLPASVKPIPGSAYADGTRYEVTNGTVEVTDADHVKLLKGQGFTEAKAVHKASSKPKRR